MFSGTLRGRYSAGVFALSFFALRTEDADAQKLAASASVMPDSWVQLRNGTDNTGSVPGTLEVTWQFKAESGIRGVSVASGMVVIGTESADAASRKRGPDQRGMVIALDARTGLPLWKHVVSNWIHGSPAIHDNQVFATFGSYPMNSPGGIVALDLKTGNTVWSLPTAQGIMPAPALDTAAGTVISAGGDSTLRALDLRTGAVVFAAPLGEPNAMASPRVDGDGNTYLGANSTLYSYSSRTGKLNWKYSPAGLFTLGTPPPALADTIVFTQGTERLRPWAAFRKLSMRELWKFGRIGYLESGKRFASYSYWYQEQWLLAVDRRNGQLLWKRSTGAGREVLRNNSGSPVVVGQRVVISSPVSQTVSAFDVSTGRELWKRPHDARHLGAATITGNDVILGDNKGMITVLSLDSGVVVGKCNAGSPFSPTEPLVVGRTIFAATRDGWLRAAPYDSLKSRLSGDGTTRCF